MNKKFALLFTIIFLLIITLVGCGEEKKIENGKLIIHYVLNNGLDDVIAEIDSKEMFNEYELMTVTKEGHDFYGWYNDEELTEKLVLEDFEFPTGSLDRTIFAYANWKKQRFNVKFYCDDKVVSQQFIYYGEGANEPTPLIKSGYKFSHWDKEFNEVKEDLNIKAVYEFNNDSKNVLVILGNWMNNDGSISSTMRKRLELALVANNELSPSYIVVTGGMANSKAGISEAQAMYNYLVEHNVDGNMIIKEDQSMSTYQNAVNTIKKLEDIDFNNLVIISTIEHFVNYSTIKYFDDAIMNNAKTKTKDIRIMIYTNSGSY